MFTASRAQASESARQALAARGVTLSPQWRWLPGIDDGSGGPHEFVSRTAGEARRLELLGRYLPVARWRVRVATFEGDLAERAEEWNAVVDRTGAPQQLEHTLPEGRAGASLDEAAARAVATSDPSGADSARYRPRAGARGLGPARETRRPHRLDVHLRGRDDCPASPGRSPHRRTAGRRRGRRGPPLCLRARGLGAAGAGRGHPLGHRADPRRHPVRRPAPGRRDHRRDPVEPSPIFAAGVPPRRRDDADRRGRQWRQRVSGDHGRALDRAALAATARRGGRGGAGGARHHCDPGRSRVGRGPAHVDDASPTAGPRGTLAGARGGRDRGGGRCGQQLAAHAAVGAGSGPHAAQLLRAIRRRGDRSSPGVPDAPRSPARPVPRTSTASRATGPACNPSRSSG